MKTRENRPLIGPLPVEGAYVSGGYSGFGVMASCAGGELIARHITGDALPDYAPAFLLSRYQDADYRALLDNGATADSSDGEERCASPRRAMRRSMVRPQRLRFDAGCPSSSPWVPTNRR